MLTSYLEELKKITLLTREEEQTLWRAYKEQGNMQARARLIEQYQPLVFKEVMRLSMHSEWIPDAIQEGTVGLIEAVEHFRIQQGVAFSLYAVHRIRGEILEYLRREGGSSCQSLNEVDDMGVSLQDLLCDPEKDTGRQTEKHLLAEEVLRLFPRLPKKERTVLAGVYLQDRQQKNIAAELSVSVAYVYRLRQRGIHRLRGMFGQLVRKKRKKIEGI